MSLRLYEISDIYNGVIAMIENEEVTEEAMQEALEVIVDDFENKADSIASLIKDQNAYVAAVKEEKKKLDEKMKRVEKNTKWLKDYLSGEMHKVGKNKVETARNKISFRKSTQVIVDDETGLYEVYPHFKKEVVTTSVDKKALGDALKSGLETQFAHLQENQNLQVK